MAGDIEAAIAPAFTALDALTDELAAVHDPSTAIPGLEWNVEDLARHILAAARSYQRGADAGVPGWRDLEDGPAENARLIEELAPEHGLGDIAAAIRATTARLHDTWAQRSPDDVLVWHGDIRLPIRTIADLVLGDALVHGWDLSRATKRDWPISREDALGAIDGITVVAPYFVDSDAARDFRGTYLIRLRHGGTYAFAFDRGALTVSTDTTERIDCRISADPRTFLLTTYGRITPLRAAAVGGVVAYGRRPWLAFSLLSLLKNP
jgi:uncharacterized protein (TIGR03083 family)